MQKPVRPLCFFSTMKSFARTLSLCPALLLAFSNSVIDPACAQRAPANVAAAEPTSQPAVADWRTEEPVRTKHAMVVSIHHLAADAGVTILQQGGNAVDAAVATGFALAVVLPQAGNLGGGGFMLIHLSKQDEPGDKPQTAKPASVRARTATPQAPTSPANDTFIDYRERAPQAATRDMYLDKDGNVIPGLSTIGYKAIGVPGSVAGLAYAEAKYGRLGLKAVMAPAIALATSGYVLTEQEAKAFHDPDLTRFKESSRIFQNNSEKGGGFYQAGDTFKQPDLAATLTAIANDPRDFYHGAIAKKLAADVQKGGGILTEADLADYEVKERQPIFGDYHGYRIVTAPPPSSGGVAVIESLNILKGYDLGTLGDRTAPEMHAVVEAYRRAFMDHADYLGDPDYANIPIAALTSQKYADAFRASILPDKATASNQLARPSGFLAPPPQAGTVPEHTNTTHYSVMDADGNAVAVTTTLNDSFGSHATAEGLGFLLNDEMDDFASKQGVPNMYGLIQGPNAAIAPGHRPLSSMTPTILLKDGQVRFVLGSPGGSRIITTVANILLSALPASEGGMGLNIQQAVDAPRFHHQYLPDLLFLEPGFAETTVQKLRTMGYLVKEGARAWSDGECIAVDPKTGERLGGQDHRHNFGKAAGY